MRILRTYWRTANPQRPRTVIWSTLAVHAHVNLHLQGSLQDCPSLPPCQSGKDVVQREPPAIVLGSRIVGSNSVLNTSDV